VLDHILVSSEASRHVLGYDVVHVNAEFSTQASDHDPGVARLSFDRTAPVLTGPSVNPSVNATGPSGAAVTFSISAVDDQDGPLSVTCSPPSGSVFAVGVTEVTCSASDQNGNSAHFDFSVTVKAAVASTAAPATPIWLSLLLGLSLLGLATPVRKAKLAQLR
jgi:hypothetical protein